LFDAGLERGPVTERSFSRKGLWRLRARKLDSFFVRTIRPTALDGTIRAVATVPADVWFTAAKWTKDAGMLDSWQRRLAYSLGRLLRSGSQPSLRQAIQGRKLMLEAIGGGFSHVDLSKEMVGSLNAEPTIALGPRQQDHRAQPRFKRGRRGTAPRKSSRHVSHG
jgi:hypothetical protein